MIDSGPNGPSGPHRFTTLKINFISGVPRPAQVPAKALVVFKRDPDDAPPPPPAPIVPATTVKSETTAMDPTKRLALVLALTAAQFDYMKSLPDAGQEAFLGLSDGQKNVAVSKALADDPIEVTLDGIVFRKSADPEKIMLAKAVVAARKAGDDQKQLARATVLKAEANSLFSALPISEAAGIELLSVIEDHVGNAEIKADIKKMLVAKNERHAQAGERRGVSDPKNRVKTAKEGGTDGLSAAAKIKKGAAEYSEKNKVSLAVGYSKFLETDEGIALQSEHDETREDAER